MDEQVTKIISQQISEEIQAGYKCSQCGFITVVMAPPGASPLAPAKCLNCQHENPVLVWGPHLERRTSVIESV